MLSPVRQTAPLLVSDASRYRLQHTSGVRHAQTNVAAHSPCVCKRHAARLSHTPYFAGFVCDTVYEAAGELGMRQSAVGRMDAQQRKLVEEELEQVFDLFDEDRNGPPLPSHARCCRG